MAIVPLAHIEIVILVAFLHPLACIALKSSAFSPYAFDGSRSRITCYGTAIDGDIYYHGLRAQNMAARCVGYFSNVGAKCGWQYSPPGLLFDNLYENMHNGPRGLFQDEETMWNTQLWAQICNIKCRCTRAHREQQTLGAFPNFPATIEYEWNFDLSQSWERTSLPGERKLILYGTNAEARLDAINHGHEIGIEIEAQSFVSSPLNRPICEERPGSDGPRVQGELPGMDQDLYRYVSLTAAPGEHFQNYEEICLHQFYGGRPGLNLGGVCFHPNGQAKLRFPYNFKAPQFTPDYFRRMFGLAGAAAIELFCRSKCACPGEPEEEKEAGKEKLDSAEERLKFIYRLNHSPQALDYSSPSSDSEGIERANGNGYHSIRQQTCSAQQCFGQNDCGSGCTCRLTSQRVDPSDFQWSSATFTCAAMLITQLSTNRVGTAKNLGGKKLRRSLFEGEEIQGPLHHLDICACNATYISAACCSSYDGYVWEAPELMMGGLK